LTSKVFIVILTAIIIVIASAIIFQREDELAVLSFLDSANIITEEKIIEAEITNQLSVIAVGDIMMGSNYPHSSSLPPDDGKFIFDDVKEYLQSADITFGNLEGPLLNSGGTPKKCESKRCVSFRMPEHYAGYLKDAGFDLLSVANNHSNDMGMEGRNSTIKTLEHYDINFAGYISHPTSIFIKNGLKIGFTAFAPNTGTVQLNNNKKAAEIISKLKSECDIVIVSFHGGAEGSGAVNVTRRREMFLNEDRGNVYDFAHLAIDAGADMVFGHGPHVPRAIELYKDRIIAYSLGNFCTYAKFSLAGAQGIAPMLKVIVNGKGEFISGEIIPVKQIKRGIPVIDEDKQVIKLIRKLTEADFPQTNLIIHSDGMIERK
jgi:poly-gamma-glutamate capsule biosynthesis protein CapA/YwtB (metallophosphatase superfamily)